MKKIDKIVTGVMFGIIGALCIGGGISSHYKNIEQEKYNSLVQITQSQIENSTNKILGQIYDDVKVEDFKDELVGDKLSIKCNTKINGRNYDTEYVYTVDKDYKEATLSNKEDSESQLKDMITQENESIERSKETGLQVELSSFAINYLDGMIPIGEKMSYGASFLNKMQDNSDGTIRYNLTLKVTETNRYNAKIKYKTVFAFNVKKDFSDYKLVDYWVER